jgi:methyl-accepting chemotaxis protein
MQMKSQTTVETLQKQALQVEKMAQQFQVLLTQSKSLNVDTAALEATFAAYSSTLSSAAVSSAELAKQNLLINTSFKNQKTSIGEAEKAAKQAQQQLDLMFKQQQQVKSYEVKFKELSDSLKEVGLDSSKLESAFSNFVNQMSQGVLTANEFKNATLDIKNAFAEQSQEVQNQKVIEVMDKQRLKVQELSGSYEDLIQKSITLGVDTSKLENDFNSYSNVMSQSALSATKFKEENIKIKRSMDQQKSSVSEAQKSIVTLSRTLSQGTTTAEQFNKAAQDLTKSVQLALGPLSGVAARITALTALFNRNTFAAAAVIGSFTALTVATKFVVRAGIEYERQMLRMQGVVESLGEKSSFTSKELEGMAQKLAFETLASVEQTRNLVTVLSTFEGLSRDTFDRAAQSAIALSDVFGGDLSTNARQVGRLLEDPLKNMDALRRTGIQFSNEEKRRLKQLQDTLQIQEMQNMVLEKFNALVKVSKEQAKGLAGAIDTAGQLFENFVEAVARSSDATNRAGEQVNKMNEELQKLLQNEKLINLFGKAVGGISEAASGALVFFVKNIDLITTAISILVTVWLIKSIKTLSIFLIGITALSKGAGNVAKVIAIFTGGVGLLNKALGSDRATKYAARFTAFTKFLPVVGQMLAVISAIGVGIAVWNTLKKPISEAEAAQKAFNTELDKTESYFETLPLSAKQAFESKIEEEKEKTKKYQEQLEALNPEIRRLERNLKTLGGFKASDPNPMGDAATQYNSVQEQYNAIIKLQQSYFDLLEESRKEVEAIGQEAKTLREIISQALSEGHFQKAAENIRNIASGLSEATLQTEEFDMKATSLSMVIEAMELNPEIKKGFEEAGWSIERARNLLIELNKTDPRIKGLKEFNKEITSIKNNLRDVRNEITLVTSGKIVLEAPEINIDEVEKWGETTRKNVAGMLGVDANDIETLALAYAKFKVTSESVIDASNEVLRIRQQERKEWDKIKNDAELIIKKLLQADDTTLIRLGISESEVENMVTTIRNTAEKAAAEAFIEFRYKGLEEIQNQLAELRNQVRETRAELEGEIFLPEPDPSLIKSMKELGDGAREVLAAYLGTSESAEDMATAINNIQIGTKFYADLSSRVVDIKREERTELENIKYELEQTLGILDKLSSFNIPGLDEDMIAGLREAIEGQANLNYSNAYMEQSKLIQEEAKAMEDYINQRMMSQKEYAVYQIEEQFSQQVEALTNYINKRIELEVGMSDELYATWQEYYKKLEDARDADLNNATQSMNLMGELGKGVAQALENSLAQFLFNPFEEGVKGMLKNFTTMLMQMVSQLLAKAALFAFFNAIMPGSSFAQNFAVPGLTGSKNGGLIKAASGGMIRGPGTSRSDSIPAMLSNGEYVIQASAVKTIGIDALNKINSGYVPGFAGGGYVGKSNMMPGETSVVVENYNGSQVQTETETGPDGQRRLRILVRDMIRETMDRGGLDSDFRINYGLERRARFG